jgi:hypothetical protein
MCVTTLAMSDSEAPGAITMTMPASLCDVVLRHKNR